MLIFISWINDIDLLRGIIATLIIVVPSMILLKIINMNNAFDAILDGFKVMIPPLMIVVAAFMFKNVNDQLGLSEYVIETVTPYLSPEMFPVIVFISMATSFIFLSLSAYTLAFSLPYKSHGGA